MTTATTEDLDSIATTEEPGFRFSMRKFVWATILDKASSVLPTKDVYDLLKNFQVTVTDDAVSVVATDLELAVIAQTKLAQVERTGVAVLPGHRMLQIAKEAEDDGDIVIDISGATAHIQVGRARWDLKLLEGKEYPELPDIRSVDARKVDRVKFLEAVEKVVRAAGTDRARPSLMMLDIGPSQSRTVMRASDGIRYQQVDIDNWWPEDFDLQIPVTAVEDLSKLLRSTDGETIAIGETDGQIVFRIGPDTFIANKITAPYQSMEEAVLRPALANDQELHVDRDAFIRAIKRVRIAADDTGRAVKLDLSANQVTVRAQDKFENMAEEVLDAAWSGPDRSLGFNHVHLLEMLLMTDVKSCDFFLGVDKKTRPSPILLKDDETGQLGVLNQLRVDFI